MFRFPISDHAELRLLELRHAEELYQVAMRNRQRLRTFLPWVDATRSVEDTRAFLRSALAQFAEGKGWHAGIWFQDKLAGAIGMHGIDWANQAVSIGYWIDEDYEGRGLVTSACRALLRHAFEDLRLNRVEIRCATDNPRSTAVARRLGFRLEGTLKEAQMLPRGPVDLLVFAMTAGEYRSPL